MLVLSPALSPVHAQYQPWASASDGKLLFTGDDQVTVDLARFGLKYASDPEMMSLQSRLSAGNSPSERTALVNAVIARGQGLDQSGAGVSQVWKDWQNAASKSPAGAVNIQLSQQGTSTYASPSENRVVVGLNDPTISPYDIRSLASPVAHEMGHIERWYSGNTGRVDYGNDNVHFTSEITTRATAFEEGFAEYRAHRALGGVDVSSNRPYILFEANWNQIPAALRNAALPSESIGGTVYKQCDLKDLPFPIALSVESVISRFLFHLASKVPGAAGRIDALLAGRRVDSIEQFLSLYLAACPADAAAVAMILDADTGFTASPEELRALVGAAAAPYIEGVRPGLAGKWTFDGKEGLIDEGMRLLGAGSAVAPSTTAAAGVTTPTVNPTVTLAATATQTDTPASNPGVTATQSVTAATTAGAGASNPIIVSADPAAGGADLAGLMNGMVTVTLTMTPDGGLLIQAEGPTKFMIMRAMRLIMGRLRFLPPLARRAMPMDPYEYALREAAVSKASNSGGLLDGSVQGSSTQAGSGGLK